MRAAGESPEKGRATGRTEDGKGMPDDERQTARGLAGASRQKGGRMRTADGHMRR